MSKDHQNKPKTLHTNFWTPEEDEKLLQIISYYRAKNWKIISQFFENRTPLSCSFRWSKIKGTEHDHLEDKFTKEQDQQLVELVAQYGTKWKKIEHFFENKTNKQLRERYLNKLRPEIKTSKFTVEEDIQLKNLWKQHGNSWSLIGKLMNRSENCIKNRFYSHFRQSSTKENQNINKNQSNLKALEIEKNLIEYKLQFFIINRQEIKIEVIEPLNYISYPSYIDPDQFFSDEIIIIQNN